MAQRPILVVDDDPDLCAMLRKALEHDGHVIVTAANGMEAIREYELNRPRMLFVDLMMPSLDGEEFLRVLGDPRPPVVLVTASTRREEVAERFGVEGAVEKPFDIKTIRALARKYGGDPSA
ncbi:MAG: response regulator [Deltaproteobacteria bacterium]|nr:MAG: response regulator [Deltaproteobacteria bacterium]